METKSSRLFLYIFILITILKEITSRHCNLRDIFVTPEDNSARHLDSLEILERCDFPKDNVNMKKNDNESVKAVANAQILLQMPKEYKDHLHYQTHPIYPSYHHQYHHHHHQQQHQHPNYYQPNDFGPYVPHYAHVHSSYHSYMLPHVHHEENSYENVNGNCFNKNRTNDIKKLDDLKCDVKSKENEIESGNDNDIPPINLRSNIDINDIDKSKDQITINLIIRPDGIKVAQDNLIKLANRNHFDESDDDVDKSNETLSKYFVPLPLKPLLEKALEKHIKSNESGTGKVQVLKVNIPKDKSKEAIVEIESIKSIDIDNCNKNKMKNDQERLNVPNSNVEEFTRILNEPKTNGKYINRENFNHAHNLNAEDLEMDKSLGTEELDETDLEYSWSENVKHESPFSRFPTPNHQYPSNNYSGLDNEEDHCYKCPLNQPIVGDISWVDVNPSNTRENLRYNDNAESLNKYTNKINSKVPYINMKPLPGVKATFADKNIKASVDCYDEDLSLNEDYSDYARDQYVDIEEDHHHLEALPLNIHTTNTRPSFARKLPVNGNRNNNNNHKHNVGINREKHLRNNNRQRNIPNQIKKEQLDFNGRNINVRKFNHHQMNHREEPSYDRNTHLTNDYLKENYEEVNTDTFDAIPIFNAAHDTRSPYAGKRNRVFSTNFKRPQQNRENIDPSPSPSSSSTLLLDNDRIYYDDDPMLSCTRGSNCRCPECAQYTRELNE